MNSIYQALKEMGFKETYWQFVYPGQIGGLVKSPRSNLLELHVRFFQEGMMYAEIEMGRSALLHFLNRRLYLKGTSNNALTSPNLGSERHPASVF